MTMVKSYLFGLLLIASQLTLGLSLSETSPAFLWSSHYFGPLTSASEVVNYRNILSQELASLVLTEGGWSKIVCSRENMQPATDIALLFIGRTLHSSDISRNGPADPALVNLLKNSFISSNFSMAFPYVTKSDETESLENSLLSDILKACGNGEYKEGHTIAISETCSVHGDDFVKLRDLQSVQDHLTSKVGLRAKRQADLILFCSDGSFNSEHAQSEGEELAALTSAMEKLDKRYTVLYASDPHKSYLYATNRALERFLAEGSQMAILNSTHCDVVCQIKSSLLEGVFVAIVLLIILLSGLCCMMGIDTPTRFETPQES